MDPRDVKDVDAEEVDVVKNAAVAGAIETDPALEPRITRKTDLHILP